MTKSERERQGRYWRDANLENAYLQDANLEGSDLRGANLGSANLRGANLRGANLKNAYLRGANLWGSDLRGAYLWGASLWAATLEGANLEGATMNEATILPAGYRWDVYLSEVVPALLVAGGRSLAMVAASWSCHEWTNCPMAVAFDVHNLNDVPPLYRREARQFVQLFDAGLLSVPNGAAARAETVRATPRRGRWAGGVWRAVISAARASRGDWSRTPPGSP